MTTTFVRVTVHSDEDAAKAEAALGRLRDDVPPAFGDDSGTRTIEAVFDGDRRLEAEAALKGTGLRYQVMADDE
ncbi:hypothetical protein [Yinghuangia sp. YIM S10712]|uniref:hypothetical protein n=1 Tax=Yinghuangia sp. YIM S10712 TaxID=3436930 RepID=UPI003F536AC0